MHCWAGISRSTSCIIAYMMLEYGMSLTNSLNFIRKSRSIVNPNPGFIKQLQEFEKKLKNLRSENKIDKPNEFN